MNSHEKLQLSKGWAEAKGPPVLALRKQKLGPKLLKIVLEPPNIVFENNVSHTFQSVQHLWISKKVEICENVCKHDLELVSYSSQNNSRENMRSATFGGHWKVENR